MKPDDPVNLDTPDSDLDRKPVVFFSSVGIPPSKKNSKMLFKRNNGSMGILSSKRYRDWEEAFGYEILAQKHRLPSSFPAEAKYPFEKCTINILFHCKTKRVWDLTNKAESIMDGLVKFGVLADDNRFVVKQLSLEWNENATLDSVLIKINWLPV